MEQNLSEAYDCAEHMRKLNCDYIQFKPLILPNGEFKFVGMSSARMIKRMSERKDFKVYIPKRYPKKARNYKKCYAFWFSTQIGASGNLHLCCNTRLRKHLYLGNIKTTPFSKLWEKKTLNKLQNKVNLNNCPVCRHDELNKLINFIKHGEANAFV